MSKSDSETSQAQMKESLFNLWETSLEYREYGKASGLGNSGFRTSLPTVLAGRKHILDLACGDGNNLPFLPAGSVVTACECSPLALSRLMERTDHPPLEKFARQCDVATLPVEDVSQDAVISSYSFEHFLEVPKILEECDRVLKPGGLLVIFGPDFAYSNNFSPPQHQALLGKRAALIRYALGQTLRRWRFARGRTSVLFEYVEPLPNTGAEFVPDQDLTYLTRHDMLAKYMGLKGYRCVLLDRLAPAPSNPLRKLLAKLGVWGKGSDARVILQKAENPPARPEPAKVTETLIHRQPRPAAAAR